jgi:hypothetical protein
MKLAIITAHAGSDSVKDAVGSWIPNGRNLPDEAFDVSVNSVSEIMTDPPVFIVNGKRGMLDAYEIGFRKYSDYDVLAFLHDDTIIHDPNWLDRVLKEFEDPAVGLVGFGGALKHGDPDMYKKPYNYSQLGRSHFLSNMEDAEVHGKRFTDSCDVAVLDGFALIFRRSVLDKFGWGLDTPCQYIGYDYRACCLTHRHGYKIRLAGIKCAHLGGRTFVKMGLGLQPGHWERFLAAHRFLYDEFKDVLPWSVI